MILQQITGFDLPPAYAAERPGDVRDSLADTAEARETLGSETLVTFPEGLEKTVEWYQSDLVGRQDPALTLP
jgi:UDP-glucose 4-epimerase